MKRNQFFSCKGIQMMLLAVLMLLPAMVYGAETITEYQGLKIKYDILYFDRPASVIGLADDNQDAAEITIPAKYMSRRLCFIEGFEGTKIQKIKIEDRELDAYNSVSFEAGAFKNCTYLTSIDFNHSSCKIYSQSFAGCTSLNVLKNYENVWRIEREAFKDCKNLTSFTIYGALERLESRPFYGSGLMYLTIDSWNPGLNRDCEDGVYYASDKPDVNKGMGTEVFANTQLTELPSGILRYRSGMFSGCKMLQTVNIPHSITNIPMNCFSGTTNLKTVTIPATMTSIATGAFSSVTDLKINSSDIASNSSGGYLVSRFGDAVTDIRFSPNITGIGDGWAEGAKNLKNITFPDKFTLGKGAFRSCTSLPSTMTLSNMNIGADAFNGSSVSDLTLTNCKLLEGALNGIDMSYLKLDNCQFESTTFTKSKLVGFVSVDNCDIPASAFARQNITGISIGTNVKSIGEDAFLSCGSLADVSFKTSASTLTINSGAFSNCPELLNMTLDANIMVKKNAFKGSFLASDYSDVYGSSDLTIAKLANLEEGALSGAKFRMINVLDEVPTGNALKNTTTKWVNLENATSLEYMTGMLNGSTVEMLYAPKLHYLTQKNIGDARNLRDFGTIKNEYLSTSAFDLGCIYSADRKTLVFIAPGRNEALLDERVERIDLNGTDITAPGDKLKCGVPVIDARAITDHKVVPLYDDGTHACAKYIRIATGCRKYFADFEKIKNFYTPTLVQDYIQGDVNDDGKVSVADVMNVYDQLK